VVDSFLDPKTRIRLADPAEATTTPTVPVTRAGLGRSARLARPGKTAYLGGTAVVRDAGVVLAFLGSFAVSVHAPDVEIARRVADGRSR
jgi:hypothetical protein